MSTQAKCTSFSTLQDLVGYIKCRDSGGSADYCLNKGDNGVGCWGDVVATLKIAAVALPKSEMEKRFGPGNMHIARNAAVRVTLPGHTPFVAHVLDLAPPGVCDLNPGSLMAAGLPSDTELDMQGEWEWV